MIGVLRLGRNVETGEMVILDAKARKRGTYVAGVTGTGKTTLLQKIILSYIEAGDGVCVPDPHGDLTEDILIRVPAHRERDVILFDPADFGRPFGLNLFECSDIENPQEVDLVCSQVMGTFWKLFRYSWGPQMEDLLRNISLTLIYNQATMADIPALLTDNEYRARLVGNIPNYGEPVRFFWEKTYDPLGKRYPHKQLEYSLSTRNKVGRFLSNPTIRNIVAQRTSSFDFRRIMDEGKIVLVKLAKGKLGEDNSALLGSIIVGKVQIAAFSRADTPPDKRRPFHLVVDEYQNFATPSFAVLQSEARKYNIDTVVAHQYRDQLDEDSQGSSLNVGNLIVFKVNGKDAKELAVEFDSTPPEPLVVGERAYRAMAHSPWSELEQGSHLNPQVAELVDLLKSMLRVTVFPVSSNKDKGEDQDMVFLFSEDEEIKPCIESFDFYLVNRMRGVSASELLALRKGVVNRGPFRFTFLLHRGFPKILWPTEWNTQLTSLVFEPDFDIVRQKLESLFPSVYPGLEYRFCGERVLAQIKAKQAFWEIIERLGMILEKEPIFVPTGQTEPIYDKQRLYSDVQAETANELANLKAFQAKCRLIQGKRFVECVIKTFPPAAIPSGGEARAEKIKARSRQRYGRSRKQVEKEIIQAQLHYGLSAALAPSPHLEDQTDAAVVDSAPPSLWGG